jgi:hypothetical protein
MVGAMWGTRADRRTECVEQADAARDRAREVVKRRVVRMAASC